MDDDLLAVIRRHWSLTEPRLEPLAGGMNSRTWTVTASGGGGGFRERWVAKLVPPRQHGSFTRGLVAAVVVEAAGIPAGRPLPTTDGRDHLDLAHGALALLRRVEGVPLQGGSDEDQEQIGRVLGAAHSALRGVPGPPAHAFLRSLDPGADHLAVEDWVRPAVRAAVDDYRALDLDRLPVGLLHGDPAPEAFLRPTARSAGCGVIDWSSAEHGPLLYDLASALMYVGGPARGQVLLEAYGRAVGTPGPGPGRDLAVVLALRQAVQADYFARRLVTGDLTGITDTAENLKGLHDARDFFAGSR